VLAAGFPRVVVVDDGSTRNSFVFEQLRRMPQCDVLAHAYNLGKGRALKTGLNHIALTYPDAAGVLTMDADGQHLPEDAIRVAEAHRTDPQALVLGTRQFQGDIPFRSRFGNVMTRHVLRYVSGINVTDSQTGLRLIPRHSWAACLRLEGEQYEYEMNMLLTARETHMRVVEAPISTIYLDGNKSSHFNPFLDSMKIYFVLLRFCLSSLGTSAVDQLVFFAAISSGSSVAASMVTARLVASMVNLYANRQFVFKSQADWPGIFVRYYLTLAAAGIVAYMAITTATRLLGWPVMTAKVAVECLLFLVSFVVTRDFVFGSAKPRSTPA
jgi:glycosyltransferase involved in cell wall biosynthesis